MDELLYLEADEEITSVIDKLKSLPGGQVALVLPKNAQLLQSVVNLKLLQREAKRSSKTVSIVTHDETGTNLASQLGIPVYASVSDDTPVSPSRRPKPEVMDVIELDTTQTRVSDETEEAPVHVSRYDARADAAAAARPADTHGSADELLDASVATHPVSSDARPTARPGRPASRRRTLAIALILGVIGLAALGWLLVLYPRATIVLGVAAEPLTKTVTVTVDNNIHESDEATAHIPGQKLQAEQEILQTFPATGTKDVGTKAAGTVTLSNRLGDAVTLDTGSTLVRGDVSFVTTAAATVHAATATVDSLGNPVVTPGTATVAIEAASPGEAGNVVAGSFVITSLSGTKRERVSASNSQALAGGESRSVTVMAEDDVAKAGQQLLEQKSAELKDQLAKQAEGLTVLGPTVQVDLTNTGSDQAPGDELGEFTFKGTLRARTIGFAATHYQAMVVALVGQSVPSGKELVVTNEDSVETLVKATDYDQGFLTLEGTMRTEVVQTVDKEALKALVAGKTALEAEAILKEQTGIRAASVTLRPAFKKRIPGSISQIEIQLGRQ